MDTPLIALQSQFKAKDVKTGEPVTVVGVDFSSSWGPKLVVLREGDGRVWPDLVEEVKTIGRQAA
ncbi:MAG: hypothetical protein KKG78_02320 [Alphaproteobacteria bacterium]|nr:hypothetical protein [Alphaproteobacteria bacterium]